LKKGKTREQPNIPIDKLFEFFKTLNEKPDADPINIPLLDPGNVNELLYLFSAILKSSKFSLVLLFWNILLRFLKFLLSK
jgi:hypothetical protein